MIINKLKLTNFRNYQDQSFKLDPVVTLVVGPNASGKTNLLESLYVLSSTKSFRARDNELIRHGQSHYRIEAWGGKMSLALGYENSEGVSQKKASHDGVKHSLVEHISGLHVVLFEPGDLLIISGSPDRRRNYLDYILSQTDKIYLKALHGYRRTLKQRNRLLSEWRGDTAQLFAWNLKLTEYASDIVQGRCLLLDYINQHIHSLYKDIAGQEEQIELAYRGLPHSTSYPTDFMAMLEECQLRDMAAGFTTTGPHRDDFGLQFKDSPVMAVASRGEIRTIVLALKLIELRYSREQSDKTPLLLLDDVFSELDEYRRHYLLQTLGGHQAVITTTDADSVSGDLVGCYGLINTGELQHA